MTKLNVVQVDDLGGLVGGETRVHRRHELLLADGVFKAPRPERMDKRGRGSGHDASVSMRLKRASSGNIGAALSDCDHAGNSCDAKPMVDVQDVFRAYIRELVGSGSQAEFSRRTGIPGSDLTNLLSARPKKPKRMTMDMLVKAAQGAPWSDVFHRLERIATHMEARGGGMVRLPPDSPIQGYAVPAAAAMIKTGSAAAAADRNAAMTESSNRGAADESRAQSTGLMQTRAPAPKHRRAKP